MNSGSVTFLSVAFILNMLAGMIAFADTAGDGETINFYSS
jgi:hypothetical protein